MDKIIEKTLEQSPMVGLLVLVVWMFLKHLRDQATEQRALFDQIHSENMEARRHSQEVIEKNTQSNVRLDSTVQGNTKATEELARLMRDSAFKNR
jgi:hypothetical protein